MRMPTPLPSSEDTDAMVARVAPAIRAPPGDGVPRSWRAPMRLAVTNQVAELGGTYGLATPEGADQP
jgi:hypothetical protein